MPTLTEELAAWVADLRLDDIPARVVDFAVSQILAHVGALAAGARHDLGRRVVAAFGAPLGGDPKQSAYVLAALTMLLDYDDTVFAGHVSHSTVGVPLAYAESAGLDGPGLLVAVLAANETAARVTAAATLGHFRGQTAAHTHLAGAVAARGRAEAMAAPTLVDAWGLAFAMPPWSLTRAFMGSDAKVLTAATPVRTGLDACDAATAGLAGAADILEHPDGFLARFAEIPLPQAVGGLGRRWHTETLSIKVYPGCAYLDAALDAAVTLHPRVQDRLDTVERVVVAASVFTAGMDARSRPYVHGPGTGVAALNFSVPYNVAVALMRGALVPADFDADMVADPSVWGLAAKVEVAYDRDLTERALLATAPVGAALRTAGDAATAWLAPMLGLEEQAAAALVAGGPEASFEDAEKAVGARVTVHFADGSTEEAAVDIALGAAGARTRARHRGIALAKYLTEASAWLGAERAREAAALVEGLADAGTAEVARLVEILRAGIAR
ncbi:MAG: MmgE/PrpD family protein [Acidimicrobiia bacterium]